MAAALTAEEGRALLALARASIDDRLLSGAALEQALGRFRITPGLERAGASFVTLETLDEAAPEGRRLRGCIGSLDAREPLYRNVIANAARAAFEDPRFPALRVDELDAIALGISVLTPLQPIEDPEQIVIGRDGVQLTKGTFSAVFLPRVAADNRWSVHELLERLALKAGLPRDGWRGAELSVFQTESFRE